LIEGHLAHQIIVEFKCRPDAISRRAGFLNWICHGENYETEIHSCAVVGGAGCLRHIGFSETDGHEAGAADRGQSEDDGCSPATGGIRFKTGAG
jgi:hypothetical protein